MATANCDWLLIPKVARVANVGAFTASITDEVFDVEFTLNIVPVLKLYAKEKGFTPTRIKFVVPLSGLNE
jgi:hypothetical protein